MAEAYASRDGKNSKLPKYLFSQNGMYIFLYADLNWKCN